MPGPIMCGPIIPCIRSTIQPARSSPREPSGDSRSTISSSLSSRSPSTAGEAVLLELVPQDSLADSQQFGGARLDAVGAGQGLSDHSSLQALHDCRQARAIRDQLLRLLHAQGEILEADDLIPGEDDRSLDEVLELPHISGGVVAEQGLSRLARAAGGPLAVLA